MSQFITKQNGCIFFTIKANEQLKQDDCKVLFNQIKEIPRAEFKDQKWMVLVAENIQTVAPNFCSVLCRISSLVEQQGMKFALIGDLKLGSLIMKNAIERMVVYAQSKEDFYQKNGIDNKENVRIFLNTLLDSTLTTMKVLLELDGIKKEVTMHTDSKKIPHIEAGAIAGIVSAHFTGSLVLGFTMDVFKKAMSRFLQAEITEITPEIKDGAAEFLNVIIGQTKIKLNDIGFDIRQVIPNVIMGHKIEIAPMSKQCLVHILCMTDIGDIHIFLSTNTGMSN